MDCHHAVDGVVHVVGVLTGQPERDATVKHVTNISYKAILPSCANQRSITKWQLNPEAQHEAQLGSQPNALATRYCLNYILSLHFVTDSKY